MIGPSHTCTLKVSHEVAAVLALPGLHLLTIVAVACKELNKEGALFCLF